MISTRFFLVFSCLWLLSPEAFSPRRAQNNFLFRKNPQVPIAKILVISESGVELRFYQDINKVDKSIFPDDAKFIEVSRPG
jgi:hypothetical protein